MSWTEDYKANGDKVTVEPDEGDSYGYVLRDYVRRADSTRGTDLKDENEVLRRRLAAAEERIAAFERLMAGIYQVIAMSEPFNAVVEVERLLRERRA